MRIAPGNVHIVGIDKWTNRASGYHDLASTTATCAEHTHPDRNVYEKDFGIRFEFFMAPLNNFSGVFAVLSLRSDPPWLSR